MLSVIPVFILILLFVVLIITISGYNIQFINPSIILMFILSGIGFLIDTINNEKTLANKGKYYMETCQLIDVNVDNGLFQSNVIKLKCGKAVEYITLNYYQKAIEAYKKSQYSTPLFFNYEVIE